MTTDTYRQMLESGYKAIADIAEPTGRLAFLSAGETQAPDDIAYNAALHHAAQAIRAKLPPY